MATGDLDRVPAARRPGGEPGPQDPVPGAGDPPAQREPERARGGRPPAPESGPARADAPGPGTGSWPGPARSAFRASLVIIAILVTLGLVLLLTELLVLMALGVIVAAGMASPVARLEALRVPRILAVVTPYVALLALLALLIALVMPVLVEQLAEAAVELPAMVVELTRYAEPLLRGLGLPTDLDELLELALEEIGPVTGVIAAIPFTVATVTFNLVTVIFLSGLMLLERDRARRWFLQFVSPEDRELAVSVSGRSFERLGRYVRGQLIVMTVLGTIVAAGMTVLGLPFALPFGLLAFLAEAIPMVGPFIYGIPIMILAFIDSPVTGIIVVVSFVVVQQFESYVLMPAVQGRAIEISPLVTVVAIIAGAILGGLVGAILAIPAVAVATVLVDDVILPWRQAQYERRAAHARPSGTGPP
jgi:predicted PurR-regulated permease PerM